MGADCTACRGNDLESEMMIVTVHKLAIWLGERNIQTNTAGQTSIKWDKHHLSAGDTYWATPTPYGAVITGVSTKGDDPRSTEAYLWDGYEFT